MSRKKHLFAFTHKYPRWIFQNPGLIQLVYQLNYFLQLRKWYVMLGISRWMKKEPAALQILDAGCGEGQYLFSIASRYPETHLLGIDKSESNITLCKLYAAKKKFTNTSFLQMDLEKLEEQDRFHIVLCVGTLQYTKDDFSVIKRFHHSLHKKGKLLLYIPVNNRNILPFYSYLMKRYENYETIQQRQRVYTESDIRQILNKAGFSILESKATYGFWGLLSNELLSCFFIIMNRTSFPIQVVISLVLMLLYPVILGFMILDFILPKKTGNGFWIVAEKHDVVD